MDYTLTQPEVASRIFVGFREGKTGNQIKTDILTVLPTELMDIQQFTQGIYRGVQLSLPYVGAEVIRRFLASLIVTDNLELKKMVFDLSLKYFHVSRDPQGYAEFLPLYRDAYGDTDTYKRGILGQKLLLAYNDQLTEADFAAMQAIMSSIGGDE